MVKTAAALVLLLATAGCANQLLSDDRLRDNTAMALGQPPASVQIADRHYDGMTNTYYVARTPQGSFNCVINGGTVLAMGITNPPSCSPITHPFGNFAR